MRYCPELTGLSGKALHAPWLAKPGVLEKKPVSGWGMITPNPWWTMARSAIGRWRSSKKGQAGKMSVWRARA